MQGCTLMFSDLHADIGALEAILRLSEDDRFTERYGQVERVFNIGDVVERGYHPCCVIERLKAIPHLISILGNHDEAFVWGTSVTGSDARSLEAHAECRRRGGWEEFFRDMPTFYADGEERLYIAHGGPLDQGTCPGDPDSLVSWLNSRTWQRISRADVGYYDLSGYHYLPGDAFTVVGETMKPGFAIICGHEHSEAAFAQRESRVEDILFGLEKIAFAAGGRRVEEKKIVLRDDTNYLLRLGIAGPGGYYERYSWDRCYFGVYYKEDGQRCVSMLSFPLGRDTVPP